MSKSKLIDVFSKSYLMINYIFCKDNGYPFGDTNILQFILSELPAKVKEIIDNLLKKIAAVGSFLVKKRRVTAI